MIEAISSIPDNEFNTSVAIEEIILLEKIEEGLEDLKNGRTYTLEEVKRNYGNEIFFQTKGRTSK